MRISLRRAGIEAADVFIAVTNGDNRNIMGRPGRQDDLQG
jgi:hypothetical protein